MANSANMRHSMQITEIYKSLQGESSYTGTALRLRAPDRMQPALRLVRQRVHLQGRRKMSLEEIEPRCTGSRPTAGWWRSPAASPCLQEREAGAADGAPARAGYTVLLETSGERPLESVPAGVIKIVDVKCPDSGEGDTFRLENLAGAAAAR